MIFAINENEERIRPEPKNRAVCPGCGRPVIACCGELIAWHWRHETKACQYLGKSGDTYWHKTWKTIFGDDYCEIKVVKDNRIRFADVKLPGGTVMEVQHSPISSKEIRNREHFYQNMIWLFDASGAYEANRFYIVYDTENDVYQWEHPRRSISVCRKPVYLDLGYKKVLHIKSIRKRYKDITNDDKYWWAEFDRIPIFEGECRLFSRDEFIETVLKKDNIRHNKSITQQRLFA